MKFPEEAKLSPEAKDIINKLLCNVSHRLGTNGADEIKVLYGVSFSEYLDLLGNVVTNKKESRSCLFLLQAHPWFNGVEWDRLYQMEAAFFPEVKDDLDTQNFENFEEVLASFNFLLVL